MAYKAIGIISYLPEDETIRKARFEKLCKLISTCNQLFNLPVFILVQNYHEEELKTMSGYKNVHLSENYPRCGIVGARKKLREWFLASPYEVLIMLDDDCELTGTEEGARAYLEMIDAHPGCYGEFKGTQLKLFAVDKNILKQVDFLDVKPEDGEGFEDTLFVEKIRKKFPKKGYSFYDIELKEKSKCVGDSLSTWYNKQDVKEMLKKTEEKRKKL